MSKIVAHSTNDCVAAHATTMLQPIVDATVARFIYTQPGKLLDLVAEHGSPLNIVWPHAVAANVAAMQAVLNERSVRYEIFYGAKANKSKALVNAAVACGVGVDISSIYEYRDARRGGATAERLCATGPAKTAVFHDALITDGALISVDSLEEFRHLVAAATRLAPVGKARVLLRYRPTFCDASRFGMGAADVLHCLERLAELRHLITFDGFHFHLGGYGFEDRARALGEVTTYIDAARKLGLSPRMIDIGGGLPMQYVSVDTYAAFLQNSNDSDHYVNRKVPTSFYPYGGELDARQWLRQLLDSMCQPSLSIAQYLQSQDLVLGLEPGRSLVDQAAISVFRITRIKQLANNKTVIFVEGSSFSACETWFNSEFLVDPLLITTMQGEHSAQEPVQAYIAGHSCLDDDVITRRLANFGVTPKPGDLLVYVNTAGYQMDLLENEFHRHPMPRRLAAICCTDENFEFTPDYEREYFNDTE